MLAENNTLTEINLAANPLHGEQNEEAEENNPPAEETDLLLSAKA